MEMYGIHQNNYYDLEDPIIHIVPHKSHDPIYFAGFGFCREFQFNVFEILCTQSSPRLPCGRTLANGYRDADTVT